MQGQLNFIIGDATKPVGDGHKIIVHCCNDIGVWGAGFVLALERRWPITRAAYRIWFNTDGGTIPDPGPFQLGAVQLVVVGPYLWVANLIGQHGIGFGPNETGQPPIRYEAIRKGLGRVAEFSKEISATVHMPRMGAGLAGGDWGEIEKIVQQELCEKDIAVTVYDLPPGY